MLSHKCGRDMERNLTNILNLVEQLAIDYNSKHAAVGNDATSGGGNRPRQLKGTFVAVGRDEMQNFKNKKPDIQEIARHNWITLNERSVSYDDEGNQLFTSSLAKQRERWTYQQEHEDHLQHLDVDSDVDGGDAAKQHTAGSTTATANAAAATNSSKGDSAEKEHSLPIFECGEGWV